MTILRLSVAGCLIAITSGLLAQAPAKNDVRHRARELGIAFGKYPAGQWNAITDGSRVTRCQFWCHLVLGFCVRVAASECLKSARNALIRLDRAVRCTSRINQIRILSLVRLHQKPYFANSVPCASAIVASYDCFE